MNPNNKLCICITFFHILYSIIEHMTIYILDMINIPLLGTVKLFINDVFKEKEPWQIVTITTTTLLTSIWLWDVIFQDESMKLILN